jgi:hypothetical protein
MNNNNSFLMSLKNDEQYFLKQVKQMPPERM